MEIGACYILFKNFRNARVYPEKGLDVEMLMKGMCLTYILLAMYALS